MSYIAISDEFTRNRFEMAIGFPLLKQKVFQNTRSTKVTYGLQLLTYINHHSHSNSGLLGYFSLLQRLLKNQDEISDEILFVISEAVKQNNKLDEYLREIDAPTYQFSSALHFLGGALRKRDQEINREITTLLDDLEKVLVKTALQDRIIPLVKVVDEVIQRLENTKQ